METNEKRQPMRCVAAASGGPASTVPRWLVAISQLSVMLHDGRLNQRDTSTTPAVNFEKEHGVEYPSLYDPTGKLLLRFEKGTLNPQIVPSTLVIDRHGKVAARALEALDDTGLVEMIKPVLAEK